MIDGVQVKQLNVLLKVAGERRATADVAFVDRRDHDDEALAPAALPDVTVVGVHRNHAPILSTNPGPPFAIAKIFKRPDRWSADIDFLATKLGDEEHAAAKALHAAGGRQDVSIGMLVEAVGPVPAHLQPHVKRYVTRARVFELSFVPVGAIPGAVITSVKCTNCGKTHGTACACGSGPGLSQVDQAELRAIHEKMQRSATTFSDLEFAEARRALGLLPAVKVDRERHEWAERVAAQTARRWGVSVPAVKWTTTDAIPDGVG